MMKVNGLLQARISSRSFVVILQTRVGVIRIGRERSRR
jgi:hypothetical protein